MANSESEDFESADEEVIKSNDTGNQSTLKDISVEITSDEAGAPGSALVARGAEINTATMLSDVNPAASFQESVIKPLEGDPSPNTPHFNPESLGAKPKVFQKSKIKSHSKHRAHRGTSETASLTLQGTSFTNNLEPNQRMRSGPSKLGIKIEPTSIMPSEIMPSFSDNYRVKEKGKSKVTWSGDISKTNTDNMDLHDSIQPLLDKLASLDVVETTDEVDASSNDRSSSSWGLWGNWGMNTILSGATSVSTHVTQGLSTVSSVIESSLGAIDPQEMARINLDETSEAATSTAKLEDSQLDFPEHDQMENSGSGLNVMGNVLKFVESTGEMIVTSGLNTLESLGKKTMDVLQEGDPGLKKKRALFSREADKPTLSQILKEAKNKAEAEDKEKVQTKKTARAHFETLFDDYRGMIHLEALEMLSNTCQLKLEAKLLELSGTPLVEFQRLLLQVKEQCDIPDDDDDEDEEDRGSIEILERDLSAAMRGLMVPISHSKLLRVSEETDTWLATMRCMQDEDSQNENDEWVDEEDISEDSDPQSALRDIHQQAIRSLARFTAAVAEHFHKTAELLLLKEEHNSPVECHCVVMMTSVLCSRVSSVAARFSELLSASANMLDSAQVDHNDVNLLITNVFLEASNSSSYIQDASLLLIPVLQLGAVQ